MMTFFPSLGSLGRSRICSSCSSRSRSALAWWNSSWANSFISGSERRASDSSFWGLGPQVLPVGLHHRGELVLLFIQHGHLGGVVVGLRSGQAGLDLTVFGLNGRQLVQHRSVPFL